MITFRFCTFGFSILITKRRTRVSNRLQAVAFACITFSKTKIWCQKTYSENIRRIYYCNEFDSFKYFVWMSLATPLSKCILFNWMCNNSMARVHEEYNSFKWQKIKTQNKTTTVTWEEYTCMIWWKPQRVILYCFLFQIW